MERVAGGGTAMAVRRAPSSVEVNTLKSRTVWFPVLHGRGFL